MGYKFIKHIEGQEYNKKMFYLDAADDDLPPIENETDIMPGSEVHSIPTNDMWILGADYVWHPCPWKK